MKRITEALADMAAAAAGLLPDALLVAGAAAVSWGVWQMHQPSGVIVGGMFMLGAGWMLARSAR